MSDVFSVLYERLKIQISTSFQPSMGPKDNKRKYWAEYKQRHEVMGRRVESNRKKIQEENEKFKKGQKRGYDYSSGEGLKAPIEGKPTKPKKANKCTLKGCDRKGHTTHRSGKCFWHRYWKIVSTQELPHHIDTIWDQVNPLGILGALPGQAPLILPGQAPPAPPPASPPSSPQAAPPAAR